jgi:hypothetical protein
MPNPAADPGGWLVWWLPALAIVAILAAAWVARGTFIARLQARRQH